MLMDVLALDRHRLFCCDTPESSHSEVASAFCDHGLTWRPGRVQTAMSRMTFEHLELFSLQYGAEVEVRPRAFVDFVLIHFSLAGILHVDCSGQSVDRRAGDAILLGQQQALRMRWAEGTRQLILKIPKDSLPLQAEVPSCVPLEATQGRQLRGLLQALLYAAPSPGSENPWVNALEQSLLQFTAQLLAGDARRPQVESGEERITLRDQRRVDRLLAYVRGHLGAPVALEDMARAADLSARGLHLLCQRHLGCTPMSLLRGLRLDAVRFSLLENPELPVTDIALEHGFSHLGRFASYYRERFGELPTETQRNRVRAARTLN